MLRLLATATLELKTFMGEIPPYAILSHTWLEEGEEVTLDDLKHGIGKARSKKGYPKLKDSARLAWLKGFAYIWIDTCCIDKASSAELSEAINSMYRWYKDAAVCYAYLADVLNANDNVEFKHSRWFTRGWTLQELIAPKQLHFYSASWEHIGSRDDLVRVIEDVTHVPRSVLGGGGSLDRVSAGAKLSWAAARVTTRAEDSAYCLMGILDVNMPLLYGEGGEKAFVRLQEEFLKSQDDESIFAWAAPSESVARDKHYWGLLAPSPAFFTGARSIRRPPFKTRIQRHPTSITNRGTSVELVLSSFQGDKSGTVYLGLLNLHATQDGDVLAIVLQRVSDIENQYVRIAADLLIKITFNLFGLPFACLSPRYNVEYSQRRDRAVIISPHLFDSGRAILRVGDPEPQLIFVPTASPRSELLAGFYLLPEIISETSSDMATLKARECLGGLGFHVIYKPNGDGEVGFAMTFTLLVGLEPLPGNPFGTPPLFIKPWYILVPRSFDESLVSDSVGPGHVESLKGVVLPNGLNLRARLSTGMRYEELLYRTDLVVCA